MTKDTGQSEKKLHDDPFYRSVKGVTCASFAGAVGFFTAGFGYDLGYKFCNDVSDTLANPVHDAIHGESYEERQKGHKPK